MNLYYFQTNVYLHIRHSNRLEASLILFFFRAAKLVKFLQLHFFR